MALKAGPASKPFVTRPAPRDRAPTELFVLCGFVLHRPAEMPRGRPLEAVTAQGDRRSGRVMAARLAGHGADLTQDSANRSRTSMASR